MEGEVLISTKKNPSQKIRKNFSESEEHREILSLEISNKNFSDILMSCCYKSPKGDNDISSMFLKQAFKKYIAEKKTYYLVGVLNINCLQYFENDKVSISTSKSLQNSSPIKLKKRIFNKYNIAFFKDLDK